MLNTPLRYSMTNIGLEDFSVIDVLAVEFCILLSLNALFGSKGQPSAGGAGLTLCNISTF